MTTGSLGAGGRGRLRVLDSRELIWIPLGGPFSIRPMAGVVHVWPGLHETETYTM
jgi:hypothetical protein